MTVMMMMRVQMTVMTMVKGLLLLLLMMMRVQMTVMMMV